MKKQRIIFIFFLSLALLPSCSYFSLLSKGGESNYLPQSKKQYFTLKDQSGKFTLKREKAFLKSKKQFIVKKKISDNGIYDTEDKVLEESITISSKTTVENNISILLPKASQYSVWFEKKKYVSKMRLNFDDQMLEVSLTSPEQKWNGKKNYPFPKKNNGAFCYFSQIIECIAMTGFVKMAVKKGRGKMNFHIVWEGYPYIGEQYLELGKSPFSKAALIFDGKTEDGNKRFRLNLKNNVIFLFVNKELEFQKLFWPSEGLSINIDNSKEGGIL